MLPAGALTDVAGITVGHAHRLDDDARIGAGWATGTTVVLTPPGTVGACDVRGGAPGTRETDCLDPANAVRHVDAVVLTGGSAYGLAAADGVMRWCEERGRGVALSEGDAAGVVPIVPAAVIFDLPVGGWDRRPDAEFGHRAAAAAGTAVATGCVGAGVGARAGALKGGVGTASVRLSSGVTVGALAVVNAAGDAVDPATGLPWQTDLAARFGLVAPPTQEVAALAARRDELAALNTTIAVVASDAALSKAACRRVAVAAHDGLARALRPCHTAVDGDTVFALATGAITVAPEERTPAAMSPEVPLATAVGAAAADALAQAVLDAVVAARPVAGIPSYRSLLPGAFAHAGSSGGTRWA